MAVTVVLSEIQRDTLAKVCDTFAPSIESDDDPTGFWGRSASDLSIPDAIEQQLAALPEDQLDGLRELLDAFHAQGFNDMPQEAREQTVHAFADDSPRDAGRRARAPGADPAALLRDARRPVGDQPELGGDRLPRARAPSAPDAPKTISVTRPPDEGLVIEADVVIVGSGAGGGVIAGELAGAGQAGLRAGDGRLLQRGRLQPARAVGLREPLSAAAVSPRPTTARSR